MKRSIKITLGVVAAVLILTGVGAYVAYREFVGTDQFDDDFYAGGANDKSEFSYDSYAEVLRKHVDDEGMVSYAKLTADHKKLDSFVRAMARLDIKTYKSWNENAKVAFWINAYNALTLKAIIDHYPIKAGLLSGLTYPANSIRQIPGAWDKIQFLVMDQKLTLNKIEHGILRGQANDLVEKYGRFYEPRIHVALVCAAMGCPPLRNEPFVTDKFNVQLDDQARRFFSNQAKFKIDRDGGKVYLSSIFDWFGKDFDKSYKSDGDGGAVMNFIAGYLSTQDAEYLKTGKYSLEYLDYDWSLNEQK